MHPGLKAAARGFSVVPKVGDPTEGRTGAVIVEVVGDLKATIVLLEENGTRLGLITLPGETEIEEMRMAVEAAAWEVLGLAAGEIVTVSSHNHCVPMFVDNGTSAWRRARGAPCRGRLNSLGLTFIQELRCAMQGLGEQLVPIAVEWGRAEEKRVTFNRKGRRPNKAAYFIREEDRLELGQDYVGEIDPEATVVVLRRMDGRPVAGLAHFTGHPVSAYHPEHPVSWGEWCQVASEDLSAGLGGAPVAFLQGCAGDIGAKYMLCGTVAQSRELGHFLGDSFLRATKSLHPSGGRSLQYRRVQVDIPYGTLPSEEMLRKDLAEIDDFIGRARADDPNTLSCVGLNIPRALSPLYRSQMVDMIRPWYEWAIAIRREGRLDEVPKILPVEIVVARIGDVGFIGMPFETYVRTGLKIKREAALPCVLPCGYTLVENGYIPDADGCDDREYMSSFYRYTPDRPPFRAPAGDAMAEAALRALREFSP